MINLKLPPTFFCPWIASTISLLLAALSLNCSLEGKKIKNIAVFIWLGNLFGLSVSLFCVSCLLRNSRSTLFMSLLRKVLMVLILMFFLEHLWHIRAIWYIILIGSGKTDWRNCVRKFCQRHLQSILYIFIDFWC